MMLALLETWTYIAEVHGATPERAHEIVEDVYRSHSAEPPGAESARGIAIHVRHVAMVERAERNGELKDRAAPPTGLWLDAGATSAGCYVTGCGDPAAWTLRDGPNRVAHYCVKHGPLKLRQLRELRAE